MKNKKEEGKKVWTANENHEFHASVWFGAIFLYLCNFGKIKFNAIYQWKYQMRNAWTGWILQIILFATIIYLINSS